MASTILGSDNFIGLIKDKYLGHNKRERSVPDLGKLIKSPDIDDTHKKADLLCNYDKSLSKKVTIYLFHNYSDKRLKEIGEYFGIGDSAVSEASGQFNILLKKDEKLRSTVELIKEQHSVML